MRFPDGALPRGSRLSTPVVAALLAAVAPLGAAEHSVRADGLGDFPTIQAAVDSADAGDVIVLEDGVFTGNGNRDVRFFGKDLVVRSRNGPGACTIDCEGSSGDPHRAFRLDAGETPASRIEGITIVGGFVEGPFPESGGGGILIAYGSHPVVTDCVFDGNRTGFQGFGAGLLAWEDCDITLTDCVFVHGESGWYGGGFVLRRFCDATVERCIVLDNEALHAGGGASITRSNAIVNDCVFADNRVTEAGGGGVLVKAEAEPVFTRCVFVGNRAWAGGGIGLGNDPRVTLVDCLFDGNVSQVGGGGAIELDANRCGALLTGCTLVNNAAPGWGQHLYVGPTSDATVRNSILSGGCTAMNPARVEYGGTLDIDCSLVEGGEEAVSGGGTLIYGPDNFDGDPMFCDPDTCGASSWPTGDYTLDSQSPATAGQSGCGLVGAFPVGCGATPVEGGIGGRSWGRVKVLYRGTRNPPSGGG
jgi:hypothetical protein